MQQWQSTRKGFVTASRGDFKNKSRSNFWTRRQQMAIHYSITLPYIDHLKCANCWLNLKVISQRLQIIWDGYPLPIHSACYQTNTETAKYLYSLYPESINKPNSDGFYPYCIVCLLMITKMMLLNWLDFFYMVRALFLTVLMQFRGRAQGG